MLINLNPLKVANNRYCVFFYYSPFSDIYFKYVNFNIAP